MGRKHEHGDPRRKFGKDSTSSFHLELMTLHCVLLVCDTKRDIFEGINDDMFASEHEKNILRKSSEHTNHRLVDTNVEQWGFCPETPAFHLQTSFLNLPFSRSDSC